MQYSNGELASRIMLIFFIASLGAYYYSDSINKWSEGAGLVESVVAYILLNPIYLSFIYYLTEKYKNRGFIASVLVVLALDIQSLPHVVHMSGVVSTDPTTFLFIDSIIFRNYAGVGVFGLYVVLPFILVGLAYEIVAPSTFVKIFKKYFGKE
jgi:hypothetical protein